MKRGSCKKSVCEISDGPVGNLKCLGQCGQGSRTVCGQAGQAGQARQALFAALLKCPHQHWLMNISVDRWFSACTKVSRGILELLVGLDSYLVQGSLC